MYYSSGNYEAFARPEKPADVDKKSAYLVGSGLASLAAACFLVRDGQMKGERIHVLEELNIAGGACDGIIDSQKGFIIRGGREMENHFECLWDLFRSIPSLEIEGYSVLDEFYRLNKKDPNYSLMRVTVKRGQDARTDGKFGLSDKAALEIVKLFFSRDEDLYDKKIADVFSEDFFVSNFWLYWRTMFAFAEWHSALEMKLYIQRFIHHIGGLPDLSALKFTKYNQYESLIQPMVKYLETYGVQFHYGSRVTNVVFDIHGKKKTAVKLMYWQGGEEKAIDLTKDDLVFVTNGSCTENSTFGDDRHAPVPNNSSGGCWELWRNIAKQDPAFGRPDKFCTDLNATRWESATITTLDNRIPPFIEKICKRDPFSGRVVTGGIVTVRDSNWLISYTLNRQPHFKEQPQQQLVVWLYGLFIDVPGNYIKKPMQECTGTEIVAEWLYHLGVPEQEIHAMAVQSARCIPCLMPYITAFFMPRTKGDRPRVVPEGCVNLAFIGQFADTERDTVFTTEYSVRTAMEAVYTLLNISRGVPEVFASCYDIRVLLEATSQMLDGKKLTDIKLPFILSLIEKNVLHKISGTLIEELLKKYKLI
ncbi:oleate hydratase [Sporomusa termitida]|uniref:Oleate hydratase n=1 Tax=Sporomusa termitida TaxID=2377 RepID=A0A517DR18_9FIRM|nr:oleate hydratase [Sporomusa termitida]QDR79795.1 Oleate hydratase [Sporomusa termitida]